MRVLAGKLRGRKIEAPVGIRPVLQRVKKSCFDIIAAEIEGKRVLDLYAGSGSLGIEALSRGASQVCFGDISQSNLKVVKKNLANLGLNQIKLYCRDACYLVKAFNQKKSCFDLIFLDPPYGRLLLTKSLQALESYDILARSGYLVAFCGKNEQFKQNYNLFSLIWLKNYGQSRLLIYRKN